MGRLDGMDLFTQLGTEIVNSNVHPILLPPLIPDPILIRRPVDQRLLARTGRHPLAALPRLHLTYIHRINLLQRPPLRLADEEIHNQHRREITPRKHIPILESDIRNDKRCEERYQEIPYPVRRRHQRHAASAVMRREQLAHDAPDDGPPRRGITRDEGTRKDNHGLPRSRSKRRIGIIERKGADGGEDQETDRHADAADDESPAAAEALHDVEAEEGHAEVDAPEDHGRHEAVGDAGGLEDCCPIIEKKIRTSQLLQRLQDYAEGGSIGHSGASEQFNPGAFA